MTMQLGMQRLGRWLGLSCTRAGGEFTGQGICFGDRPTMYHRSPIYYLTSFESSWMSLAMRVVLVSRASAPRENPMTFYKRTQLSALSLTWIERTESSNS